MKLLFSTLILLLPIANADDLSQAVSGWVTEVKKPTRKLAPVVPPSTKTAAEPLTPRQFCELGSDTEYPPEIVMPPERCAKNAEEIKKYFPEQSKLTNGFKGTWSDFHVGDYEEKIYLFQKIPGNENKNHNIPVHVEQNKFTVSSDASDIKIQVQKFGIENELSRTEVLVAELCRGPEGFYLKTEKMNIQLKFKGPNCLWVGLNGKWRAERLLSSSPIEFRGSMERGKK